MLSKAIVAECVSVLDFIPENSGSNPGGGSSLLYEIICSKKNKETIKDWKRLTNGKQV